MANEQNLIQFDAMTPEKHKELSAAGGIASGKARRKAKSMREAARFLLESALMDDPETKAALETLGLEADQQSAILLRAIEQARRGDMESARYARDTSGQAPAQQVALGGVDGQPIKTLDLSGLSNEELQRLISDQDQA